MDELIRYIKKTAMRAVLLPLRLFPVRKNRVLLHNNLACNYSDNTKFIAEYLNQTAPEKYELVISVKHPEDYPDLVERGMKVVRFNSIQFFFYAMTSSVFVTNSGGYSYLPLRKKQYVINTWHGGGAYKKAGIHMFNNSRLYRKDLLLSAKKTNVFLSTCKRFTEVISDSMLVPRERFWEIGMPRNDMLIHEDPQQRQKIREKLGLKEGEKLVLFAPTYRKINDNYFKDSIAISYGIDSKRVCQALKERFGGDWKFAFRFHPCVTNREELPRESGMDLSDYPDMQELLCAADVMINDFSSSMWDFMLTGRPSFLFAVDLEHYVETTEVYTPVSTWPFPQATDNDKLVENILTFDEQKYKSACMRHYQELGGCETGKATQLVCERIEQVCFGMNS
jgi:CDP-glycerol glycerophosphotransferase